MGFQFVPLPAKARSPARTLRLGGPEGRLDGGLNVQDPPAQLDASQASALDNLWYHKGRLRKRPGLRQLAALGTGAPVDAAWSDHMGGLLVQSAGGILRAAVSEGAAPQAVVTPLYTLAVPSGGQSAPRGVFVDYYDGWIYYINGLEFLRMKGNAVETVTPYIPLGLRGRSLNGSNYGTLYEEPNLLTPWIRVEFTPTAGQVREFILPEFCRPGVLPQQFLFDGVPQTGYTVNGRTVTLGVAVQSKPSVFVITAYLDSLPYGAEIRACTQAAAFGADSRIFLGGNGSNRFFISAPFDPTYFPRDQVRAFGTGAPLTGFGKLYDILIVFQPRELAAVQFSTSGGELQYDARTLNPVIGCDMPGSILTIGNRLVWANSYAGVHMLVSTSRENERNVHNLSRNIDPLLLAEPADALKNACALDWEGRYFLGVGGRVYVWDYLSRAYNPGGDIDEAARRLSWYVWSGVPAGQFFRCRRALCLADRTGDALHILEERPDDWGRPVAARYRSGLLDCGLPGRLKTLDSLRLTLSRETHSRLTLRCLCEGQGRIREAECAGEIDVPAAPGEAPAPGQSVTRRLRRRAAERVAVELSCDSAAEGLDLAGLALQYYPGEKL